MAALIEIVAKTVAAHFIMRVGRTELAPADFTSARVGNRLKCGGIQGDGDAGLDRVMHARHFHIKRLAFRTRLAHFRVKMRRLEERAASSTPTGVRAHDVALIIGCTHQETTWAFFLIKAS